MSEYVQIQTCSFPCKVVLENASNFVYFLLSSTRSRFFVLANSNVICWNDRNTKEFMYIIYFSVLK